MLAQAIARHLRVPGIVMLLGAGVALGPDGLGWLVPRALGDGLFALVSLGVAVILFEGGLGLDLGRLRAAALSVRRLVTWGALATMAGAALAASLLLGWSPSRALLFGSLVIVTGPTVVRPILRTVPLSPRLATVLEAEGLLIDSIGAVIAAVTLQIVVTPTLDRLADGALGMVARLGFGALAGLGLGFALAQLLRMPRVIPGGLENLVALGGALTGFVVCEAALPDSGVLAVTIAGVVVGNRAERVARQLSEFQEALTLAVIGMLFVLLAADVRLADVQALGPRGVLVVAALVFVVRPIVALWCTRGSDLSLRERLFVAWLGPRGVVAAAVASLAAAVLEELGIEGGREVRALVFLTIAMTVIVLGGGAPVVARLLRVRERERSSVVLLGADQIGLALGEILRETSERVVFADNNSDHCLEAERRGFAVVFGDASDATTLSRMQLQRARAAIALTTRPELNQLFVAQAREEYDVPDLYVAGARGAGNVSARFAQRVSARILFDREKDLEAWNVRLRHGRANSLRLRFDSAPDGEVASGSSEAYLILAVKRGPRWEPMCTDWLAAAGDEALVLQDEAERADAEKTLSLLGWRPVTAAGDAGA
ncbi:MAG: cation:proton antiporter [bacterium]